jgi:hypothetical protein
MIYIIIVGIKKRKEKLTSLMNLFRKYLKMPENERSGKIMELEDEIAQLFPFEV